jgi:hypothetical protein
MQISLIMEIPTPPLPAVTDVNKSWFIAIPRWLTSDSVSVYRFRPQFNIQISLIMQMW